jgi:RNA polymerase sigma-70 factor (ECF subfamily)
MLSESNFSTFLHPSSTKSKVLNEGDYSNSSDKGLWNAFKSSDEAAFIQIYTQYANVLYNYGCQFSPDKEMVKDCLQDFFIYLRKNRAGFGETSSIKLYLFKAFKRRVIDYQKKHNTERQKNESFLFFQFPVELSSETVYIKRQLEDEQINKLNEALKALDNKEREAIYYFYYEGLGYEQIAEIFSFTHVSSARRLIYRGLAQLRKLILFGLLLLSNSHIEFGN